MVLDQPRIAALLQWAKVNHTSLHPHVEVYEDPITGLSFRAVEVIPSGSRLVDCSYNTVLCYLNATHASGQFQLHGSPPFPRQFLETLGEKDPHIIGHFFLMQQYLMGEKSFWRDYIRLLPQPDEPKNMALPIWWSEADRSFLDGTNAEPPIRQRQNLWKDEWSQGSKLLGNNWDSREDYTYILYQWAATIFGTRSFRASLTIPQEMTRDVSPSMQEQAKILDDIRRDRFSVLLPVLDIGNHNGANCVTWSKAPETKHFILSASETVRQGSQIYNFYGDKSNSELLVGYGFILPTLNQDMVNLKLTPAPEAARLRRSQECHLQPRPEQAPEEFMFKVQHPDSTRKSESGALGLKFFSHGLFETLVCMVANSRERQFIQDTPRCCVEKDPDMFVGAFYLALFQVLPILSAKLISETKRIRDSGLILSIAQNENQKLALEYRNRQLAVLEAALPLVIRQLHDASSFGAFCKHDHHLEFAPQSEHIAQSSPLKVQLLSLECAFDWLHIHYPDIHDSLERIISEDQEEPLPLNWSILVEDWDTTYWIVWVYLVWMLWTEDQQAFEARDGNLNTWLLEMNSAYHYESLGNEDHSRALYADPSEHETINDTIQQIKQAPQLCKILETKGFSWEELRNFASLIAYEETIQGAFKMQHGESKEQKLLVMRNRGDR